jgi:hypothetical protein
MVAVFSAQVETRGVLLKGVLLEAASYTFFTISVTATEIDFW